MVGKKLMNYQRWSEANPQIIIQWGVFGEKPDSIHPGWSVSVDTPKYEDYFNYMFLAKGRADFTRWELEDFISKNLCCRSYSKSKRGDRSDERPI